MLGKNTTGQSGRLENSRRSIEQEVVEKDKYEVIPTNSSEFMREEGRLDHMRLEDVEVMLKQDSLRRFRLALSRT